MDIPQCSIHSSVDEHWDYFYFLTKVNNADMNIYVYFLHGGMFLFLLGIPRRGIDGSYDNFAFNLLRISQFP